MSQNLLLNAKELLAAAKWAEAHVFKHHPGDGDTVYVNFSFTQAPSSGIGIRTDVVCDHCYSNKKFLDISKDITDYEAW